MVFNIIKRQQARRATIRDRDLQGRIIETSMYMGAETEAQAEREAVERASELGVRNPHIEIERERGQSILER